MNCQFLLLHRDSETMELAVEVLGPSRKLIPITSNMLPLRIGRSRSAGIHVEGRSISGKAPFKGLRTQILDVFFCLCPQHYMEKFASETGAIWSILT